MKELYNFYIILFYVTGVLVILPMNWKMTKGEKLTQRLLFSSLSLFSWVMVAVAAYTWKDACDRLLDERIEESKRS